MISKKQYLKALETVREYEKQLRIGGVSIMYYDLITKNLEYEI